MPRVHGDAGDVANVRLWVKSTLLVVRDEIHYGRRAMYVSVNDVFCLIRDRQFFAPPEISVAEAKRGQALCGVFRNQKFYRNTGETVLAEFPYSKRRRIAVWEYLPEYDTRPLNFNVCNISLVDSDDFFV